MLRRKPGAVPVVHQNRVRVGQVKAPVRQHDRDAAQILRGARIAADIVEHGADQHYAVGVFFRDRAQITDRLFPLAARVAQRDFISPAPELALDGISRAGIVRNADIHREHSHRVKRLSRHAARNGARRIIAAREHFFHTRPCGGRDISLVVQNARDRGDRNSGLSRDVINIHDDPPAHEKMKALFSRIRALDVSCQAHGVKVCKHRTHMI